MRDSTLLILVCLGLTGCVSTLTPGEYAALNPPAGLGAAQDAHSVSSPWGQSVALPVTTTDRALIATSSMRLFKLDEAANAWSIVEGSAFDPDANVVRANRVKSGVYRIFGRSNIIEIVDLQARACGEAGFRDQLPEICTVILCPAFEEILGGSPGAGELPGLGGGFGGVCEECFRTPVGPLPECDLPDFRPVPVPLPGIIRWPFDRSPITNACAAGSYPVGQTSYNFEDEFDLIPSGSMTPAYPDVDVRAVVRYPATSDGTDTPVASGDYPLVVFLHGNHATCPCSCSHSCAPNDRIKNHIGYNYLLDILASQGMIAVSIDGFDVTCAGSFAMSDYEARGRLVLRHLEKWQSWNSGSATPFGSMFVDHVDMERIGLVGHSRGGEGVVAAENINRVDGLGFDIKAVAAIAPTDQDPNIQWIPEVPYLLILGARDGDVSSLQGLRTYDQTSLEGTSTQSDKSMLWVHGANHNFFNTAWTPGYGEQCANDDGGIFSGEGNLAPRLQQLTACHSIHSLMQVYLKSNSRYRPMLEGRVKPTGLEGVDHHWAYQDDTRLELDNFENGTDPNTNSRGGSVTTSGGFVVFDEFQCRQGGGAFNGSFYHNTRCLVLGWDTPQTYTSTIPSGDQNLSAYSHVALRIGQIFDNGTQNPPDEPKSIRVGLRNAAGQVANVNFDLAALESPPFPYEGNGAKTVMTTLRLPLSSFKLGTRPMPLSQIVSLEIEFDESGLVSIDDIQFTR